MTVEAVLPPFTSDFADLSKQLGLFDSMEPFTADELAMLENGTFDLPAVTAPQQTLVPDLGAGWPSEPAACAVGGLPVAKAASGIVVPDFVKLEDLHTVAQQQLAPASLSPASSGSQTSCYAPSCEGASSDFTDSPPQQQKKDPRIGKRKPDVDLSTISDPAERRKQRRLAKNRATAATSRERKRRQLVELQQRVAKLEADNAALTKALARRESEVVALKADASVRPMH